MTDIITYAKDVWVAIKGNQQFPQVPLRYHPFGGLDIPTLRELVDNAPLEGAIKDYDHNMMEIWKADSAKSFMWLPVQVTKGGRDKRGMVGWVLHEQDSLHNAQNKALWVLDVENQKDCWASETAVKLRMPNYDEWEKLVALIDTCENLAPKYTRGLHVSLKSNPQQKGVVMFNCSRPQWNGNGIYQCKVQWFEGTTGEDYVLPAYLNIL